VQASPSISANIGPTLDEQATSFYINRYVIGHPDEPRTAEELIDVPWIWSPILKDAMVALGLAGLSNLRGDTELMTTARGRYGQALRQAGALMTSNVTPSHEAMRLIVMLALFEVSTVACVVQSIVADFPQACERRFPDGRSKRHYTRLRRHRNDQELVAYPGFGTQHTKGHIQWREIVTSDGLHHGSSPYSTAD
jgi:hypothetical protein